MFNNNMKLLFYINALEHGGAARVLVTLGNELASRGHSVYIMADTLYQKINYKVSDNVNLLPRIQEKHLKIPKCIRRIFIFFDIRKEIKRIKPDVITGFMPRNYFIPKVLTLGLKIPVIASERNNYNIHRDFYEFFVRKFIYRFADAVTFLSQCDVNSLGNKLPQKIVMYNPIEFPIFDKKITRKKNVLAAGRLDGWNHKGFDNLINVWSRIANRYPDWTLEIAGDGTKESLAFLQKLVLKRGMDAQVKFLGFRTDMDVLFQTSSIFVLSSRYEGLGTVLLEAMSQGCACIAFEFDGRTKEFITTPEVGIVVKNQDMDELEKSITKLIENESLRESLSEGAKKEMARFSKQRITDNWEALFMKVTNAKPPEGHCVN